MKILFFSHYFPPEGNAPASRTFEHCKRWVREGCQVTVVTCAPNCPTGVLYKGYRNRLWQWESVEGVDVLRVWTYIAPNKGVFRRTVNYASYMVSAALFALLLRRPDVIVATSPQFLGAWAGVLTHWVKRVPFVLEVRDVWPDSIEAVDAMRHRGLLRLLGWLARRLYAAADHIVTVGDGYRDVLAEKGVAPEKITVIMNGIDRELFSERPANEAIRKRYGLDGKFVVSYVGTIGMASGLSVVLRAAKLLKQEGNGRIVFLLVGDGAMRQDLERKARSAGLDNVIFTGCQPKESVPDFLATSDACLMHLRKQDLFATVMPSKFFEAAGMKRPIINGVAGFAAEFVKTADGGVSVEPENEVELAAAAKELAGDPDLCARFAASGFLYVSKHHDRDRLAEKYLGVLRGMLGK